MKFIAKIAASAGLTLVLATASFAQHVKTDYDHSANFGQYKTFSWEKVQTKDALLVDRIKSAVNSALEGKGWMEVPSGGEVEAFAIETTQNPKTEKLIWRSSSSDTLSDNADKNTKNLDKGVNKMFQHFPPAPSTKH